MSDYVLDLYDKFILYRQARNSKDHALSLRGGYSFGIACGTDSPSLDWQAADCVERTSEHAIFQICGKSKEERCHYCGSYVSGTNCTYCGILAERGIDTHNITFDGGYIQYAPPGEHDEQI